MIKIRFLAFALAICLLAACAPSAQVIQTAIAKTQAANPTSTFTPIPPTETLTKTPTETPTITPSPTPDLLLLQLNLRDFLLQQSDFPLNAHYSSIVNSVQSIPNEEVDSALVEETGRIDGWSVWYGKGNTGGGWQETISDEVILYRTSEGAQLAVTKYSAKGYTEEINSPEIGYLTRALFVIIPDTAQSDYVVAFSYQNCMHVVNGFGLENEIAEFVRNIARILLARLQASPLMNP